MRAVSPIKLSGAKRRKHADEKNNRREKRGPLREVGGDLEKRSQESKFLSG